MKLYKSVTISIFAALITVMLVYGGYTIYAKAAEGSDFRENGLEYSEVFDRYHGEMNDYFNDKLEKLNILMEKPNFFRDDKFKTPIIDLEKDDFKKIIEKCGEENLSSYCVSMGALNIYMDYVGVLNNLLGTLAKPPGSSLTAEDILSATSSRNDEIVKEIETEKTVIRSVVAVYDEYRIAYSVHKKYQEIIKYLVQYKLALKDINKQVSQFPINFIDATTSQCE